MRGLSQAFRRFLSFLLLLLSLAFTVTGETTEMITEQRQHHHQQQQQQQCSGSESSATAARNYYHLVVLVHGYMGSEREQDYFGEALIRESEKLKNSNNKNDDDSSNASDDTCKSPLRVNHRFVVLNSKANTRVSTDGIAKGGKRLAAEILEWVEHHRTVLSAEQSGAAASESTTTTTTTTTTMTLSLVGNSLGGLYSRYALAELGGVFRDENVLPLVFCTTSSPHLGVSQETFIELPRWIEPHVATVMQQQTMNDLFQVNNSTVVAEMCGDTRARNDDDDDNNGGAKDFLGPLGKFRKRIAVANAYKTDFLVSVSSGAFLSLHSDSIHQHQDLKDSSSTTETTSTTPTTRLMNDTSGYVALQVVTPEATTITAAATAADDDNHEAGPPSTGDVALAASRTQICVDSLDNLGWLKIFIDSRKILPSYLNRETPEFVSRSSYTSRELKEHFETYGSWIPVAHPLNMANAKTDWYRTLTKSGQPIVDALAELVVLDMVQLSETHGQQQKQQQQHLS